jgi:primase-polymerase (primpol)-like protein
MQTRHQWVCWRYETDESGKQKKPPYNISTGLKVDTSKPLRAATYQQAVHACCTGPYDGIGYIFLPAERIVRIDLDDCRDPQTGVIHRWAQEIIDLLNSHTETSPSGDGIHILAAGQSPGRDRSVSGVGEFHTGKLECFSQRTGYFTWTNWHVEGTPETIEERSRQIRELYDYAFLQQILREQQEEHTGGGSARHLSLVRLDAPAEPPTPAQEKADAWLLQRARSARNGTTFAQLYDLAITDADGGQHAGDLALCVQLLYWCRDEHGQPDMAWADRLFRKSARMRPKWDRKLCGATYGQVTMGKAWHDIANRFGHHWQPASRQTSRRQTSEKGGEA